MNSEHPFFKHIQAEYPEPDNFTDFIASCNRPLRKSIRINTLKVSIADFNILATKRGWKLSPIPWCSEGFWIDEDNPDESRQLGNSVEHLMGLFYIQEASSMLPASALLTDIAAKRVLDMAAAPGSKTTQLAALMNNEGLLLANELSSSRLKVLQANLQRCGVINTSLSHFDGIHLSNYCFEYFDAILLDAPCSGEGTLRKDPRALDNWSLESIESISSLQKKLLLSAWKMLKPGGRLVYSTCTLSKAENHQVVNWLQSEVGSALTVLKLDKLFVDAPKAITSEGYLHIWPELFDCEGFFLACIEKAATNLDNNPATTSTKLQQPPSRALTKSKSVFEHLSNKTLGLIQNYYGQHFGFDLSNLMKDVWIRSSKREQQIWYFPQQSNELAQSLKLQRRGIRICDLIPSRKGSIIKTNHQFISCFGDNFTSGTIEVNAQQTCDCYQGKNIALPSSKEFVKGEIVMRHQGIPLGLGKLIVQGSGFQIKNNLPRSEIRINAH
ncbi:MAG: NOL1/NOP2/sun family putative RNA methylase [Gammaproteobacteria bacterium]|nr:NOL1/NOP2/sun family putative RNA methylase [Gammaproteobacteria bacterium]